jgi:GNAT superfamily N-acetyltransferase
MSLADLLRAHDLPQTLSVAPSETARFGVSVARVEIAPGSPATAEDVLQLADDSDAAVVVVRFPADRVSWSAALAAGARTAFHADTIVYWEHSGPEPADPGEGFDCRVAGPADRALVHDLAADTFADYGSHYRANPVFDPAAIGPGYAEWAVNQIDGATSTVLIVDAKSGPAAFVAVGHDGTQSEITLSGVSPSARGRGAYRASMAAAETFAAGRGDDSLVISTQVHNLVVQRVWAARGYVPVHAFDTVHLVRPAPAGATGLR